MNLSETMKRLRPAVYDLWCSFCLWPVAYGLRCPSRHSRKGQTTVEYLLMLAIVVGLTLIVAALFHKRILGGFFSLVGMVIGAGKTVAAP